MAILVTGAAGLVGRAAVAALLRQGVEHVRAVVRDPAQAGELRRLGAKVAVMDAADPDGLAAVMTGVFTACSLTGSLWSRPGEDPYAAVVDPAEVFLAAARSAGARRVVVCTPAALGTTAPDGNRHLAAKGEVERLVAGSGLEHAILRCTHVLGPGSRLLELLAGGEPGTGAGSSGGGPETTAGSSGGSAPEPVPVPGDGRQRVAPVWVGDVAAAIAAADDAVELAATWSLAGPDELPLDALVDTLHGRPAAKRHLAGDPPDPRAGLTPDQVGVLAAASLPDPSLDRPPGLRPTPLAESLARSLPDGG